MSARTSLLLSFAQSYSILLIRLGALVVLSRLLAPAELGVFIAASALVAIINVMADCGLSQFTVQARSMPRRLERSIMGGALVTAWGAGLTSLGVSLFAPASLISDDVRAAVAVLAATFLAYPFAVVGTAMLQREMRFRELATVTVISAAVSVAVSIGLALLGMGYMSLAWGAVVESVLTGLLIIRLHPPIKPALGAWRVLFGFTWLWSIINGMKQGSDAIVRLGVSAMLGLSSVGVLARAQNIMLMFDRIVLDAIGVVLLPALSRRLRDGGSIGPIHSLMLTHLSAIAWPFFVVAALCAEPLIRVLLGPLWLEAIWPFRILCIGGLFLPFSGLAVQYLVSLGLLRQFLPYQACIQTLKAGLALAASQVSLELACVALIVEPALKAIYAQRLLRARLGAWNIDVPALSASAAATLAGAAGASLGLAVVTPALNPMLVLALAGGLAAILWLAVLALLRHPLVGEIWRMLERALALVRRRNDPMQEERAPLR